METGCTGVRDFEDTAFAFQRVVSMFFNRYMVQEDLCVFAYSNWTP